ncbi:hypothetical protein [Granulicella arctica]|uniref:hypothetical protein n=1 Tax=Granulicella arctica TaxID=940613 RepID=UPI0021DFD785|nr:hypothetical protein [Granulicella arctica]
MHWSNYVACFFAGMFLANAIPHYITGVCGDPFPTPFAKPPGKGLSSPIINVLWALLNMVIGYLLFQSGHVLTDGVTARLIFFAGVIAISIMLSINFAKKHSR